MLFKNNKKIVVGIMLELYKHQQEIVDENKPKLGLFHSPGLGKTITLLELAKKNKVKALIICPKGIKNQWIDYVESYNTGHVVMTKEEFRKNYNNLPKFDAVIVDECHHFSGPKSKLHKTLMWYMKHHDVHYRWLATGTPYRSSPMNIYALGKLLGHNWDYWRFFNQFFSMVQMGTRQVPVPRKGIEDELESYVKQIGVTLAMESVVDVPEQTFNTEVLELTESQQQAIKDINEPVAISRFTKEHCVEQGFSYGNEYEADQVFESNKTDRIVELCYTWNSIAIVARYTLQISLLEKRLKQEFPNREMFVISGSTKDRHDVVNKINNCINPIVLIQSQCSEGYELPKIDAMVFASLDWSHVNHTQMKARILRMNALKENAYYYLLSEGIDESVYKTIMNHQDFHERLYAK